MEERVMGRTKSRKVLYKNGWAVGALVASVIIIVFLAHIRDVYDPILELLLVGIPIGIVLGALVGLAVEGPALSRKRRITIGLLILLGFFLYDVTLVLYFGSRT
jgi:predicted RND superfamily exporter protein